MLLVLGADGLTTTALRTSSRASASSFLLLALTYTTVGMLITPRNTVIGLVFCVAGLLSVVSTVTWVYTIVDLYTPHRLPGTTPAMVVGSASSASRPRAGSASRFCCSHTAA